MSLSKEDLQRLKIERYQGKIENADKTYQLNVSRLEIFLGILFVTSISVAGNKVNCMVWYNYLGVSLTILSISITLIDILNAQYQMFKSKVHASITLDSILDDEKMANEFNTHLTNETVEGFSKINRTNTLWMSISVITMLLGIVGILLS